jgi:hypothetical protein
MSAVSAQWRPSQALQPLHDIHARALPAACMPQALKVLLGPAIGSLINSLTLLLGLSMAALSVTSTECRRQQSEWCRADGGSQEHRWCILQE